MGSDQPNVSSESRYGLLLGLMTGVLVIWAFLGWFALHQKHVDPGIFGDMFGAVNALFSGLAFAGLIYTIHLQRKELTLQRIELRDTRKEIAGQKEQLKAQNELMATQGFETTFFQVLSVFSGIAGAMTFGNRSGRDCFEKFYASLRDTHAASLQVSQNHEDAIRQAYAEFYGRFQNDIGHYFRTLYNLVKLVDRAPIGDKHFYTNLLRAQLSGAETLLIFYNCAVGPGEEKFQPLVEKYALLKNMPRQGLLQSSHEHLMPEGSFGADYARPIPNLHVDEPVQKGDVVDATG